MFLRERVSVFTEHVSQRERAPVLREGFSLERGFLSLESVSGLREGFSLEREFVSLERVSVLRESFCLERGFLS